MRSKVREHQAVVSFLPTLTHQVLKHKCHSKIKVQFSPPPDPEPWLRDFAWGEKKAMNHIGAKISPMELTLFATKHGGIQAKAALKTEWLFWRQLGSDSGLW